MLIDVLIRGGRNVIKHEAKKIVKSKDLIVEIQHMWNMKAEVIPIITGANGTISKLLRLYLSNTPEQHKIKPLQKEQPHWALHTHCGKC
jgi:hypothetical protein